MYKFKQLKKRLRQLGSVLVAYSGGVDSTFLLKVAYEELGSKVLAVTACSATYPLREFKSAKDYAKTLGVRHKIIKTNELENRDFSRNPKNRCYYCKKELFAELVKLAKKYGLNAVIDGSNADDLLDYRPGTMAKKEFGIVSPLQEAGLTKKEIRQLSKESGLKTWEKPALACLASRIPYGMPIDVSVLDRIDKAEEVLRRAFNLSGNVRVRDFGDKASIEVDKNEIARLLSSKKPLMLLNAFGYNEVVVDPKGYRCGSLNEDIVKMIKFEIRNSKSETMSKSSKKQ